MDAQGNESGFVRYQSYGTDRDSGGALNTDKKFTGQTNDVSFGLYYYAARYYDPVLGRFVGPDTVVPDYKNPQALNRYSYALNNPIRFADPTGHDPLDSDWETEFANAHRDSQGNPKLIGVYWRHCGGVADSLLQIT